MWTAASFCTYLLQYYTKYLSGSIFINYYFDGLSSLVAFCLAIPLYWGCRTQIAFIVSFLVTISGSTMVLLLELE